ncbi:MAG: cellulose synthase subunit BcsC [bacterium ADurb.Bin374]|nr:MAG: cellulose synthase subunit BcsC [bacterium ADurb.Bin374]
MRYMTFRALCFCVALMALPACPSWAEDLSATLFNQGMQLYARQDYRGAADYLGQVCDMSPDFHQARFYLVYSLLATKRQADALEQAKILCEKNPGNQQFVALRDQIAKTAPVRDPAKPLVPTAIPQEVILGGYNSVETTREPRAQSATPTARPAAKPQTDLENAISAIDTEQFASAAQMLDAILKKDPKNYRALHYRGVSELNRQRYAEARTWFEKALAVKSDNFETLFLLGDAQLRAGMGKEAEGTFSKALKLRPNDVFAMLKLAEAKRKQGALKEAVELYAQVKQLDPNVVEARLALAETLVDQGKLDEAATTVNEVLSTDQANLQAHFLKGRILYRNNLLDDAATEMKLALNAQPDNIFIKVWLAKVLLSGFKMTEALDVASQILKDDPDNYDARLLTAEALIGSGEVADAGEHLDQAAKKRTSPELTRLRAMLARKAGNNDEAKKYYSQYIHEDAGNGYASMEYAQFLEEIGEIADAMSVLESVKTAFPDTSLMQAADARIEALRPRLPEGGNSASGGERSSQQPERVRY